MAEVLSQNEIDALLSAVSTGDVGGDEEAQEYKTDWIAYDLTSQEKIIRSRFAALEGIHDRFASLFRVTLSGMLKRTVSVNCIHTDFLKFGDYLSNILLPTSLNIVLMPRLKGHTVIVMSSKLTYALVDAYYGGNERPYSKIGGREEFTSIENQLLQKMVMASIDDLKEAWRINYEVDFRLLRTESNPQFVGAIHPSEIVAVVSFEVEFENLSGPFVLIIQLSALEAIQQKLAVNLISDVSNDVVIWRQHWINELSKMKMDMVTELGTTHKNLKEIRKWKVGDEIMLAQDSSSPLTVRLEGLKKLEGMMGTYRGNKAVQLTKEIEKVGQTR